MKKLLFGFIAAVVIIGACNRAPETGGGTPNSASPAAVNAPEQEIIVGEERAPIVKALTKSFDEERDKMEKVSFYTSKNQNYLSSRLVAYISLSDNYMPLLRVKPTYYGDDWVFFESVKVMADDVVIYDRLFKRSDVVRDNSGGSVWESADYLASDSELAMLKAIANSKTATIRFSGSERRHDHDITSKERKDINNMIDAYEKLREQLVRKPGKSEV